MFSKANYLALSSCIFVLQEDCEVPLGEVLSQVYKRKDTVLEGAGKHLVSSLCYSLQVKSDCESPVLSESMSSDKWTSLVSQNFPVVTALRNFAKDYIDSYK